MPNSVASDVIYIIIISIVTYRLYCRFVFDFLLKQFYYYSYCVFIVSFSLILFVAVFMLHSVSCWNKLILTLI